MDGLQVEHPCVVAEQSSSDKETIRAHLFRRIIFEFNVFICICDILAIKFGFQSIAVASLSVRNIRKKTFPVALVRRDRLKVDFHLGSIRPPVQITGRNATCVCNRFHSLLLASFFSGWRSRTKRCVSPDVFESATSFRYVPVLISSATTLCTLNMRTNSVPFALTSTCVDARGAHTRNEFVWGR